MAAYLFAHFTTEKHGGEQVYFSVSRGGLHWQDLHGGQPVLRSGIGTMGVRDPFIVRHPLTGMYHLMATDLCIITCKDGWYGAKHTGSRDITVWDSPDLVHWSPPRTVTVAPENAGCAWALEAVWNQEKQAFFVFFAPYTEENGETADTGKLRIYASYTKDFLTFTPSFRYFEHEHSVIDTTIVWMDGIYYRFSKDEATKCIRVDKGDTLMADFIPVQCPVLDAMMGLEGPECYQLPDGRWCLICDQFAARKGYLLIIIDDLRTMQPVLLREDEYDFGRTLKRHGGVIRIEDNDYQRLINHYGI